VRGTSDRVRTVELLDQDVDTAADPLLGALCDEFVGEGADPRDALGDDVGVELAVELRRLGAVLVRVAEYPDRVEPRRAEEPLELGEVDLGLAREADDDVAARAEVGCQLARAGEQLEERDGVAEPLHPA
jgi:hypothetical protein